MEHEDVVKMQRAIAMDAVALLMGQGSEVSTALHEVVITLIGQAWGLPQEITCKQLGLICKEREAVA